MKKTQAELVKDMGKFGWRVLDTLLNTDGTKKAKVLVHEDNMAIVYPNGDCDRATGAANRVKYRLGWFSPIEEKIAVDKLLRQKTLAAKRAASEHTETAEETTPPDVQFTVQRTVRLQSAPNKQLQFASLVEGLDAVESLNALLFKKDLNKMDRQRLTQSLQRLGYNAIEYAQSKQGEDWFRATFAKLPKSKPRK